MAEKLTPRQVAGRLNQKKSKGLTDDGRVALREAALRNQPWRHSTGPRTETGKMRSRGNALKTGRYAFTALPEELKAILRQSPWFGRRRR